MGSILNFALDFFSGKITIILGTVLAISLLGNWYLNNKNNDLREEITRLEVNVKNLSTLIEKQNQAIKELEANSSNLKTEYEEISEKYEKIKLNKVNAKEYAKKNGIGVVLDKKSSFYVDGITNITDEVVKELNSRYVKVEKKK